MIPVDGQRQHRSRGRASMGTTTEPGGSVSTTTRTLEAYNLTLFHNRRPIRFRDTLISEWRHTSSRFNKTKFDSKKHIYNLILKNYYMKTPWKENRFRLYSNSPYYVIKCRWIGKTNKVNADGQIFYISRIQLYANTQFFYILKWLYFIWLSIDRLCFFPNFQSFMEYRRA